MKKLLILIPLFAVLLIMQSCDPDATVDPLGPNITIDSGSKTIAPDSTFSFQLNATKGDGELNSLRVTVNSVDIDPSLVTFDGVAAVSANLLLVGDGRNGFSSTVAVKGPSEAGVYTYNFALTDANNLIDDTNITVTVVVVDVPATLSFSEESGYFFMDGEVTPNQLFKVKMIATNGSGELNSLSVLRDDVAMDAGDIFYNKVDSTSKVFPENPFVLVGDARIGFCYELLVRAHSGGVAKYDFEIADTDGEVQKLTLNMAAGTPVDSQKVVLLLNAGGGQQTGGVNLITGASVNSTDTTAHIIDKGIDTNLPAATNWIQKIAPGATSQLRTVGAGAPEGFSFSTANTKEAIQAAFETGDTVTESAVVNADDIFLVAKSGKYFVVKVNEVNIKASDNTDNYVLEVKF